MANEAKIHVSMIINKGKLVYQSQPTQFQADVGESQAGKPGGVAATVAGTDVDLSGIATPGLCRIMNVDETNYVTVGMWDGSSFYPMLELLPGETYILRLARNIGEEYGVGTGTTGAAINTLRIKADTADCEVLVEAFEA